MAYEYCMAGTQRIDQHAYIGSTRSDYATKIYNVSVYGASTSGTGIVFSASGTGAVLTTTTALGTTAYIAVAPVNSSTTYCWGQWDNSYGVLINGPVLFVTRTGFTFATVTYQQVLK